jgi:membrane protein DedA with SNARE-associated domain
MATVLHLLAAWGLVFVMNVVPAFMPPTWSVLAVLHIGHHLPLLPLTIGGAAASTAGRTVLAWLSLHAGKHLPEKDRTNATALANAVEAHPRWQDVAVFGYCLGPFPSNSLFIAAGIGRLPLKRVAVIFFVSRAIGDTFWVWTATGIARSVGDVFTGALTSPRSIAVQIFSVALVVAACRLPWAKWLNQAVSRSDHRGGTAVPAET